MFCGYQRFLGTPHAFVRRQGKAGESWCGDGWGQSAHSLHVSLVQVRTEVYFKACLYSDISFHSRWSLRLYWCLWVSIFLFLFFFFLYTLSLYFLPNLSLQSVIKGTRHAWRSKSNNQSAGSLLCRCHFHSFKQQNNKDLQNSQPFLMNTQRLHTGDSQDLDLILGCFFIFCFFFFILMLW